MKINFMIILSLLTLSSCAKKEKKITAINGEISSFSGEYILLKQHVDIDKKITKIIDTLYVNNGSFSSNKNLEPHLYFLVAGNKKINFAFDKNQKVNIQITYFNTDNQSVKITGSKDSDYLFAYENFRKESLDRLVKSVRRKVKKERENEQPNLEKIKNLELEEIENYKIHLNELNDFVQHKIATSIAIYATSLRWKGGENLPIFKDIFTRFEKAHPNLQITKKLKDKVARIEKTAIGSIFENIKMNSNKEKSIPLYSIHKKYTLIDFWASWCGPCRTENEMLQKMYAKYHSKGFEIYNISLDKNKSSWLKAIEEDQRNWSNVSSLKGFKTKAAFRYNVTALPTNYLIDEQYKIVAKNLHGKGLEKTLETLFRN